jgi:hypothetical protein
MARIRRSKLFAPQPLASDETMQQLKACSFEQQRPRGALRVFDGYETNALGEVPSRGTIPLMREVVKLAEMIAAKATFASLEDVQRLRGAEADLDLMPSYWGALSGAAPSCFLLPALAEQGPYIDIPASYSTLLAGTGLGYIAAKRAQERATEEIRSVLDDNAIRLQMKNASPFTLLVAERFGLVRASPTFASQASPEVIAESRHVANALVDFIRFLRSGDEKHLPRLSQSLTAMDGELRESLRPLMQATALKRLGRGCAEI